ncbi:DUF4145 domain-containing protein [Pseudonocardia nantongensis]|uniref:DUF4145 domain-containing protein n=1 Tax=Pseudonocardia nantongensis TaxID=1181885 RepID=UPI00397BC043
MSSQPTYLPSQRRKEIDAESYTISDYIAGIVVSSLGQEVFDTRVVAMGKFRTQASILSAAREVLDSQLADIAGVIQAEIFDSEITSAKGLLSAGHVRSAGVVAGVVLEKYLQDVAKSHSVSMRKKPTLGPLNDALKESNIIDVPTWRMIQYLADVRNLCAHKGDQEPTRDSAEQLIDRVDQVVKTIY